MFHSSWYTLLVGCIVSVFVAVQFLKTKTFAWLLLYGIIVFINHMAGDEYFKDISTTLNEFAVLFFLTSVAYYVFQSGDRKVMNGLLVSLSAVIVIAAIGSLVVNALYPGAVREAGSWQDSEHSMNYLLPTYYKMGMSNYLLPHGLPIIIPPLVMWLKLSSKQRWIRLVPLTMLAFSFILIFLSGSSTALILSAGALVVSMIIKINGKTNYSWIWVITILSLIFMFFPELFGSFANLLGDSETASTYVYHLKDIEDYATTGSASNTGARMELYGQSLGGFLSSPIWGINTKDFGGHSTLLDRLAALGLLGFIPLIALFRSSTKYIKYRLSPKSTEFYMVSCVIAFLMLLIKGIWQIDVLVMFFVMAPLLLMRNEDTLYNRSVS